MVIDGLSERVVTGILWHRERGHGLGCSTPFLFCCFVCSTNKTQEVMKTRLRLILALRNELATFQQHSILRTIVRQQFRNNNKKEEEK